MGCTKEQTVVEVRRSLRYLPWSLNVLEHTKLNKGIVNKELKVYEGIFKDLL